MDGGNFDSDVSRWVGLGIRLYDGEYLGIVWMWIENRKDRVSREILVFLFIIKRLDFKWGLGIRFFLVEE